jgi:CDP-diacylglycerol--glycerol-3-phosphate 3-phosphatidyltransferase/cardiolipin synthase
MLSMGKMREKGFPHVGGQEVSIRWLIPSAVSSLRLIVFPFLILSINYGQDLLRDVLFLFAVATDYLDGYSAKRLGVSSESGARVDATLDFMFIFGMFTTFVLEGFYSAWVLLPIVFMFTQFMATSVLSKTLYDPLGKYYGSFLYGVIGLTMLVPGQPAHETIVVLVVLVTVASIVSRLLFLYSSKRKL